MNKPSDEQQDIITQTLAPLSVTACAGSGKTFTAVRRVDALRGPARIGQRLCGHFSFSNVAVDVFGRSYLEDLKGYSKGRASPSLHRNLHGFDHDQGPAAAC